MDRIERSEHLFGSILLLANKLQAWGDGLLEDISFKQWFLLLLISKMETANPTVTEIADFAGTSRQNVKKILNILEKKGYVCLNRSGLDARALNVLLTDKTFEYFRANEDKAASAVIKLFSEVSDRELNLAITAAEKLLAALEG
jgi:DNA-binding MarR family transcriptional regulator